MYELHSGAFGKRLVRRSGAGGPPEQDNTAVLALSGNSRHEGPSMNVTVNGKADVRALLDTQASHNFISEKYARECNAGAYRVDEARVTVGVSSVVRTSKMRCDLNLCAGRENYLVETIVLEDLVEPVILGMPFLQQARAVIDLGLQNFTIGVSVRTTASWVGQTRKENSGGNDWSEAVQVENGCEGEGALKEPLAGYATVLSDSLKHSGPVCHAITLAEGAPCDAEPDTAHPDEAGDTGQHYDDICRRAEGMTPGQWVNTANHPLSNAEQGYYARLVVRWPSPGRGDVFAEDDVQDNLPEGEPHDPGPHGVSDGQAYSDRDVEDSQDTGNPLTKRPSTNA